MEVERSIEVTKLPRVVVADVQTEESEERWRNDLKELHVDLVLVNDSSIEALFEAAHGAHIIISKDRPIDEALLERVGPQLHLLIKLSRWPISIDTKACQQREIRLRMVPQIGRITVAEHAMALVLACARAIIPGHIGVVNGSYRGLGLTPSVTTEKSFAFKWLPVKPFEIYGKTLGIIGLGEIGKELAVRARGFGMEILYYELTPLPRSWEKTLEVKFSDFRTLLESSDFVSLHVPHTEETNRMLGKAEFQIMKPAAYLINTARGAVVDEDALVWALKSGEITGVGLDVFANEPLPFDHPLVRLNNVVLSPHIGGGSGTGRAVLAQELRKIIQGSVADL